MSRLIDTDALENEFGISDADIIAREVIRFAPTVDAVPVVRCQDCKNWKKDVEGCTEFVGRCAYANYMIGANGYCLYGEKRRGEYGTT